MSRSIQLLIAWCWAAMLISCSKDDTITQATPTPPVISNFSFSPQKLFINPDQPTFIITGSLNYTKASGGVAFVKIKPSTGPEYSFPIPENNLAEGILTGSFEISLITTPGNINFEIWIVDYKGFASNKLSGSIEVAIDDNGTSWRSLTSSVKLWKVRWLEDNFVGVGENGSLVYLSQGSTWEPATTGVNSYLRDVCWTGGYLITVGDNSTILTSIFGDEWDKRAVPVANARLNGIAWSGNQAVVVGTDAENQHPVILRSFNASTWSKVDLPQQYYGHLNGVIWANNKFLAFGKDGSPVVYLSTDGVNWSRKNFSGFEGEIFEIVWTGTFYCAVGPGITAVSPDGINWTSKPVNMVPYGVTWSGKYLMMTSFSAIFRSETGLDWTEVGRTGSNPPMSIAWSGKRYVAVGGIHGPSWIVSP